MSSFLCSKLTFLLNICRCSLAKNFKNFIRISVSSCEEEFLAPGALRLCRYLEECWKDKAWSFVRHCKKIAKQPIRYNCMYSSCQKIGRIFFFKIKILKKWKNKSNYFGKATSVNIKPILKTGGRRKIYYKLLILKLKNLQVFI